MQSRPEHCRAGQDVAGQGKTLQVRVVLGSPGRKGQKRTGQDRTGQYSTDQDSTGQDRTGQGR